ncbi:hypothetical protein FA15DRAFT_759519 [Coprinopsis marcescibilis]|uniref:Nephrocystin 3-like N-terminal domain-containing protein n=1 Tax=Coprinopsis marcescibilis TaxID=230819 RepID=A0A5C3KJC1_COPMA|nr:hypothetical protein FA15DRAFT_759519 [Coprinopsis marcescibilis]
MSKRQWSFTTSTNISETKTTVLQTGNPAAKTTSQRSWSVDAYISATSPHQVNKPTNAEAFTSASNVNLNNSHLQVIGGNQNTTTVYRTTVIQNSGPDPELQEALRRLADPKGCSWDPDRTCLDGTRLAHLEDIFGWIEGVPGQEKCAGVLAVADAIGSGKSALAHTVSREAHTRGYLVASFFFTQMNKYCTPSALLACIIRGLCDVSNEVKKAIADLIIQDNTLATAPPARQFQEIIIPICTLIPPTRLLVVAIDALDELDPRDIVVLKLLRDSVPHLPSNFRFVITTRPEKRVMQFLEKQRHVQIFSRPLTGESSRKDLKIYIRTRLSDTFYGDSILPELMDAFVKKTEGVFLWGETVLNHLESAFDAVEELEEITQSRSDHWKEDEEGTKKLDELYVRILSNLKWTDKKFVEKYTIIMGALVTLKEPLTAAALASLYAPKGITANDIHVLCTMLQPLLQSYSPNTPNQPIRLLHLSIREYLTERAPAPYHVNFQKHHQLLCQLSILAIQKGLTPAKLPFLGCTDGDWVWDVAAYPPRLPWIYREEVSAELWYACRYLEDHILSMSPDNVDGSLIRLLKDVVLENSRSILEVTVAMGGIIRIVSVQKRALEICSWKRDSGARRRNAKILCSICRSLSGTARMGGTLDIIKEAVALYTSIVEEGAEPEVELEYASSLYLLAFSLYELDRAEEGLEPSQKALEIVRRLLAAGVDDALPTLAQTLHTHGLILSVLDREGDALQANLEALNVWRTLVKTKPGKYEHPLACSLHNAACDWGANWPEEDVIAALEESVEIHRILAGGNYGLEPSLANSLFHHSRYLADKGRYKDALAPAKEGVDLRRKGVQELYDEPHELARALYNYSSYLDVLNMSSDAVECSEEAVSIYRQLAEDEPVKYQATLAYSLHNHALYLNNAGRRKDSVEPSREAVKLRRELSAQDSDFNSSLAISLDHLSWYLDKLGQPEDSLGPAKDAIDIRRELSAHDAGSTCSLAQSLHDYALSLSNAGHLSDALQASKEAVDVRRNLAEENPDEYNEPLSLSLAHFAWYLSRLGRDTEAIEASLESTNIRRKLAARDPDKYDPMLAGSLDDHAGYLDKLGRYADAAGVHSEIVDVHRKLVTRSPQNVDCESMLAEKLNAYAWCLGPDAGRGEEGLTRAEESVAIYRRLAATDLHKVARDFANSLDTMAHCLNLCKRYSEAAAIAMEGIEIYRSSVAVVRDATIPDNVEGALYRNRAHALASSGREDEALTHVQHAIEIYQRDTQRFKEQLGDSIKLSDSLSAKLDVLNT